jgi:hypothetical protein
MKRMTWIAAAVFATMAGAVICRAAAGPEEATPAPREILSTEISGSDLAFLTGAAPRMALLARLSELAKKEAVTPEVQAEAAQTSKEQTEAAGRLAELAGRLHVPVAQEPDGPGRMVLQTLGKLKGVKFDKSYLDAQGDAQDSLETSLEAGAASTDETIKAFAEAGLETLKQERARVRKLGL